ncbi:hypothetical protein GMDG_06123 [Pseudogymnoascus destructans 20631-21]|uniref:Uncharacterized protein n=1 Tax=Pseudogymnoascus destructans (strain ATCC MYA-4855 / 20631-21) TaxID=658429 RepID=L8FR43_PSED2|nr:hypothetical protein GMDG_06123 [Pseudogymnoascus destructans 20631-21]
MPVPPPSLVGRFLHPLSALPSGQSSGSPGACLHLVSLVVKLPWFLDEEYRGLVAAKAALPVVTADVVAAAVEANRVATQSVPKFRSAAERDSYEEARATRAAIEAGFAQIQSSLRRLRTEQGGVPALLEEVVAAVGKLPAVAATAAMVPVRAGRRKEGEGTFGAEYGEWEGGGVLEVDLLLPSEPHGKDLFHFPFLYAIYHFAARLRRILTR